MIEPQLSIVIPTRNRTEKVLETIRLMQEITEDQPIEILIGDNSETPYAWPTEGPVRGWHIPERGVPRAQNHLVAQARAPYVMAVADDFRLYRETVPTALKLMGTVPPKTIGIPFHYDLGVLPCHAYLVVPETWVMSQDTFQGVGGMNERFVYGYADTELGYRALHSGYNLIALRGVCTIHAHVDDGTKKQNMGEDYKKDEALFFQLYQEQFVAVANKYGQLRDLSKPVPCLLHNTVTRSWKDEDFDPQPTPTPTEEVARG